MSTDTNPYDGQENCRMINEDRGLARDLRDELVKRDLRGDNPFGSTQSAATWAGTSTTRISRVRDHHPECSEWFEAVTDEGHGLDVTEAGHQALRDDEYRFYPDDLDDGDGDDSEDRGQSAGQQTLGTFTSGDANAAAAGVTRGERVDD